jgi:RNAse (barnase) inhibitor barstar
MNTTPGPDDLVHVLRDPTRAGVYSTNDDCACTLYHAGPGAGFNVYRIDLGQAHDVASLHNILERSLHFPDWYGANWDALADCLTDMSWNEADGYLLILQRTEVLQATDQKAFDTLLEVLRDTVVAWRKQGVAFWTLFIGHHPELPLLEVHT